MVRNELRKAAWRRAATRMQDMQGMEHGIDQEASQALLFCGKTKHTGKRSVLRTIFAGGVWAQQRAFQAHLQGTDVCSHCDSGEDEDRNISGGGVLHGLGFVIINCRVATGVCSASWPKCMTVCVPVVSFLEIWLFWAGSPGKMGPRENGHVLN